MSRNDWLNHVTETITAVITKDLDAASQLADALQWRGFLAGRDAEGVVLHTGDAHADDVDLSTLSKMLRIERLSDPDIVARVDWPESSGLSRADEIRRILEIPSPQGMTAAGYRFADWDQFRNCRYGYGLPACDLDFGVALLVRALPLISVPTRLSGHGVRQQRRLHVQFDGPYAATCFKAAFHTHLARQLSRPAMFEFHIGSEDTNSLIIGQNSNTIDAFRASQELGRLLIRPEVFEPLRGLKTRVCAGWTFRPLPEEFYERYLDA